MKKILYVGSECMPFGATGGLGDVMGSLPAAYKAQNPEENDVRVVMPLYDAVGEDWRKQMKLEAVFTVWLGWREQYCGVFSLIKDDVIYYFIDNEFYFRRGKLYGEYDDGERFAFFSQAVLEMFPYIGFYPDVLHANDWQSALSVIYLNTRFKNVWGYDKIKTVFTIHNIEYQGKYDMYILGDVFGLDASNVSLLEWQGCMNLMKGAIECADKVTTVSPRYAEEIQTAEYAHGLQDLLRGVSFKVCGILNGIDYNFYNPETDPDIEKNFTARALSGKKADKKALQEELGLPVRDEVPVFSIISRLVAHKGTDLLKEIGYRLMAGNDIQLVVLGTGEHDYEEFFRTLEKEYPDKVRALIKYDRKLSKRIYAASDFFIMPSKSEPCGLSQMICSRYGAVPITRETGGLYDSIKGYWVDENGNVNGNGFTFANYSAIELYDRIQAALNVWADKEAMKKLCKKVMKTDFSWGSSAEQYAALYNSL
ncbi:MAG: glycogen synthase GlgA [Ruminococcaceae bacterium]|nr:glycogen synthase GlgA [Oscillospiraceae bacterium]